MGKKKPLPGSASEAMVNNPFAALAGARDQVPEGEAEAEEEETTEASEPGPGAAPTYAGKLVVRREKKGRGGKTASVIEGLHADANTLAGIAKALRKELGCGAHVEDDRVVVGGAQVDRVCEWLRRQGARRVIAGN